MATSTKYNAPTLRAGISDDTQAGCVYFVELFGALRVYRPFEQPQTPPRFHTHKTAMFFAYLAYMGDYQPRASVIELFWPGKSEICGRDSFYTVVSKLRRQFELPSVPGEDLLESNRYYVGLTKAFQTDVSRYHDLLRIARQLARTSPEQATHYYQQAAELYGNGLLPGYYDDWVVAIQYDLAIAHEEVTDWLRDHSPATGDPQRRRKRTKNIEPPPSHPVIANTPDYSDRWAYVPVVLLDPERPVVAPVPQSRTAFFGREEEASQVLDILRGDKARIVTLTGMGGIGKTRLARHVAKILHEDGAPGKLIFVDLSQAQTLVEMCRAILTALGQPENVNESVAQDQILAAVSEISHPLILLDNADHIVDDGAEWLQELVMRSSQLSLLVTSRSPFQVDSEYVVVISTLATPTPGDAKCVDIDTLVARFPSLQLYRDRARQVLPSFVLSNRILPDIVELLNYLEGIPLAIELAAARARMMSARDMVFYLEGNRYLALLHHGRKFEPRHRSLRDTIAWSADLMSPAMRRAFALLCVFEASFSLKAARAVLGAEVRDDYDTADTLHSLANASLLITEDGHETGDGEIQVRYRMLDTIRDYARDLITTEEREQAAERHAQFYRVFATESYPQLYFQQQEQWFLAWRTEHPNLRTALLWHADQQGHTQENMEFCTAMTRYWTVNCLLQESIYLEQAITQSKNSVPVSSLLRALNSAGTLALEANNDNVAHKYFRQARWLTRPGGVASGQPGRANILINLAIIEANRGRFARAAELTREAIELLQKAADTNALMLAAAWGNLGGFLFDAGDFDEAERVFATSLALAREVHDLRTEGIILSYQGDLAREYRKPVEAESLYRQSLVPFSALGDEWSCAISILGWSFAAQDRGDAERAVWLSAIADATAERLKKTFPKTSAKRRSRLPSLPKIQLNNFAEIVAKLIDGTA